MYQRTLIFPIEVWNGDMVFILFYSNFPAALLEFKSMTV